MWQWSTVNLPALLYSILAGHPWHLGPRSRENQTLDTLLLCSVLSHAWFFATPWRTAQQASLSFTISHTCSNSCPLSQWCHLTILSSVIPFSSCLQSFQALVLFERVGFLHQVAKASVSAPVLLMNIQDWFPLGWTDLTSLLSKGLSKVSSNTTVQKHQFFGIQPSLCSNSHIHTWLLEKP